LRGSQKPQTCQTECWVCATNSKKEEPVREHPDNYDAELLLRLYDLRREPKLRQAREWFIREFQAKSFEEFLQQCPPGSEKNAYFRMNVSYWEMAASIVNHGLITEELFFENTPEFWTVWDKIRGLAADARERFKNPTVWKNLETLAEKYEQWMAKRAPQALESLRQRLSAVQSKSEVRSP
jgi:hypothetical protein